MTNSEKFYYGTEYYLGDLIRAVSEEYFERFGAGRGYIALLETESENPTPEAYINIGMGRELVFHENTDIYLALGGRLERSYSIEKLSAYTMIDEKRRLDLIDYLDEVKKYVCYVRSENSGKPWRERVRTEKKMMFENGGSVFFTGYKAVYIYPQDIRTFMGNKCFGIRIEDSPNNYDTEEFREAVAPLIVSRSETLEPNEIKGVLEKCGYESDLDCVYIVGVDEEDRCVEYNVRIGEWRGALV